MAGRVLYLDAQGLTAWHRRDGAMCAEAVFAAADAGFAAYLDRHRGSVFYVLADIAEEEYRVEDIPSVGRRDRQAIIGRRLAQLDLDTPLKAALGCGRLPEGRRDERMLFAALAQSRGLAPWLEALRCALVALAGVFSTAQLAGALPSVRRCKLPHLLVITRTRSGLRQTLLERGRLRFSRLTPLPGNVDAAGACAGEAARFRQYLTGRPLAEGSRLAAMIIVGADEIDACRAQCKASAELAFECVELGAEASRSGLKRGRQAVASEALLAHLLLRNTPSGQFAPDDMRHSWKQARVDTAVRWSAGGWLASCLLFAGIEIGESYRLSYATASLRTAAAGQTQTYRAAVQALPPSPLAPDRLRPLVMAYDELRHRSPGPVPAYRRLAAALAQFPQVALDRLVWRLADRGEDGSGRHAELDIHAALPPGGDPRGQIAIIEALAERLRADLAARVTMIAGPLDAASDKPLSSDAVGVDAEPRFVLHAAIKR